MKVTEYESFFSDSLYRKCWEYSSGVLKQRKNNFFTNLSWSEDIVHDSAPVLVHTMSHDHPIRDQIIKAVYDRTKIDVSSHPILFYYWLANSYIPWHHDGHMAGGLTIYLNPSWDRNSGGLFLYETNTGIRGVVPEPNKGILQLGGVPHATTPVMPRGGIRHTIQLWIT